MKKTKEYPFVKKQYRDNDKKDLKTERVVSTLFIAIFPVLLLAIVSNVIPDEKLFTRIGVQVVILFFQLIILKRIFDDYYKYLE